MPTIQDRHDAQSTEERDRLIAETEWRILHKINNSPAFNPRRLLYVLIEEFALMFEALVVRVCRNSQLTASEDVFQQHFLLQDLNVSPNDYEHIQKTFPAGEISRCITQNEVIALHHPTQIGTNNYTLRFLDSVLCLPIRYEDASVPVAAVELYYARDSRDVPNRSEAAAGLLRHVESEPDVQRRLLNLLSEIIRSGVRRASAESSPRTSLALGSVRASKLKFLRRWAPDDAQTITDDFRVAYARHFESVDVIFSSLHERFTELPDFYFSFRRSGDDHLSFFPTAKQVAELQRSGMSMGDFKHLWTYPYKEGGLNGYVLKTAHPIYLPNQHKDSRFEALIDEPHRHDFEFLYDAARQKVLLPKLFRLAERPLYTYIVPILRDDEHGVLVAMHCTTNDPALLTAATRKRMFDFAWETSTAMELALLAQDTTEEKVRLQERAQQAEERLSFSTWLAHTLPKFIFKPSEYYIQRLYFDIDNPKVLFGHYKALAFFNAKGQSELRWFLDFHLLGEAAPDTSPSGSCTVGDLVQEIRKIFDHVKALTVVGHLDRYDTTQANNGVLREIARERVVPIEVSVTSVSKIEIRGASEAHLIALWDIVDNALASFDFTSLYKLTTTEFRVKIEGADLDGYCRLRVANNGRDLDPSVSAHLKYILDSARSGERDVRGVKQAMDDLKASLHKENPCQGLYRTARFLHDLNPASPGYITFGREDQWTVFDLYIPKWA